MCVCACMCACVCVRQKLRPAELDLNASSMFIIYALEKLLVHFKVNVLPSKMGLIVGVRAELCPSPKFIR